MAASNLIEISGQEKIRAAFRREAEQEAKWEAEQCKREAESAETARAISTLPLRPAHMAEYVAWLKGYLAIEGNDITHAYDYRFPVDSMRVPTSDISLPPLYGAFGLSLIVPVGITVKTPDGRGHSNLYYMDGFRVDGGFVPAYTNIVLPE